MKKIGLTTAASLMLVSASLLGACSNNAANEPTPAASSAATATVSEPAASPSPSAAPETPASPEGSAVPETAASTAPSAAPEAAASTAPSAAPEATAAEASAGPGAGSAQPSERPQTKSFGEQEGGVPGQEGTLKQGDGYSLYIFDGFTFDPKSGRLSLTEDPDYYAEIEPLPAGYDLAALKKQGQTELSANGKPKDYSGELIEHPLGYAELYLQTSGEKVTADYIVWKNQSGEAYLFRIHDPNRELGDKFSPWTMVSLSTLEGN